MQCEPLEEPFSKARRIGPFLQRRGAIAAEPPVEQLELLAESGEQEVSLGALAAAATRDVLHASGVMATKVGALPSMVMSLLVFGCSGDGSLEGSRDMPSEQIRTSEPRSMIVTSTGLVLNLVGPARVETGASETAANRTISEDPRDHSIGHLAPEELAEALRLVTIVGGNE